MLHPEPVVRVHAEPAETYEEQVMDDLQDRIGSASALVCPQLQPPHTASFTSADVALFAWGSEVWCRGGRLAERGQLSSHELAEFCALQVRAALPHP